MLALLCSGQGGQHASMFALTGEAEGATSLFDHAASLLGADPRTLVQGDSDLFANRTAQLLCSLQSLAAATWLAPWLPARRCVAGYSVGEVAAWGVAGSFAPELTLDLVAARAACMDAAATPGQGMLFVRGLPRPVVDALCRDQPAAIAIANPGDAWVIGGIQDALQVIGDAAQAHGASRVVPVRVKVASHTFLMKAAAAQFDAELSVLATRPRMQPGVRLLSGIDGASVLRVDQGLHKLARQLAEPVEWGACLQACVEAGTTAFLELGPGRALAEMAAGAYPSLPARSLDDFRSLDGVRDWLDRVVSR